MNVIDLDKLENKVSQGDGGFVAMCPACAENGQNLRSKSHLRVWPSGKFSCVINPSDREHNARILQLVGTESDGTQFTYVAPESKITQPQTWPLSLLAKLIKDYSYFEKRGISSATQEHFQLGVALTGQLNQRVCCPILSEDGGVIIGFSARSIINREPRWKILGTKKHFVYPAWLNGKVIEEKREVILVEGIGCVLSLWEAGIKNSICLFGTNLSSKIIAFLIKKNPQRIILALNNEESGVGLEAAKKIKKSLSFFFNEEKLEIRLPLGKDFNEMSNEEIRKWYNS
jgi:DNA primase